MCLEDAMPVSFGQNCLNLTFLHFKAMQPTPVNKKVCKLYLSMLFEIFREKIICLQRVGPHTVINGSTHCVKTVKYFDNNRSKRSRLWQELLCLMLCFIVVVGLFVQNTFLSRNFVIPFTMLINLV